MSSIQLVSVRWICSPRRLLRPAARACQPALHGQLSEVCYRSDYTNYLLSGVFRDRLQEPSRKADPSGRGRRYLLALWCGVSILEWAAACFVDLPSSAGCPYPSQSSVMQAEDSWPLLHPRFSSFTTVPLAQAAALCGAAAAACLATRRRTMRRAEQAQTLLVTTEIERAPAMLGPRLK